MKEGADTIISIIGALGIRELLAYGVKWWKDNNDAAKERRFSEAQEVHNEIDALQAKVELIQMQLNQAQQRNVKLETAMTLSLQFIERTNPEAKEIVDDIKALLAA